MPAQAKTIPAIRSRQNALPMPLKLAAAVLGVCVIAASAHIAIPFWPVPMTMQSGTILLLGAIYGSGLAEATLASYLVAGAIGLPVFASGAGLAYLAGPTAGYLLGFFVAASLMGFASSRGLMRGWTGTIVAFLAGITVIYGLGLAWLALQVGWNKALAGGLVPFLPAEATKIAMAILLYRAGHMLRPR
ncbi:MAG TPA: biotin transporter BioY [Acidisoma sp.]|jgi:biotin transport system substrate-specific component|uniref:biotin transporter BioY n=1 Tax=Acidisoma sp. TaxID=1872115 RepID=UPI002C090622|nr:biotin transporter BioY [Acidisoma sp.]HTI02846.1 biotin transporter BioY [Acidisoma sp.]